jgi:hypothetical protein
MAIVRELVRDVMQKVRACPRETATNAYVRAARQLCGESRWFRQNLDAVLVPAQNLYDLGSDPWLEIVDVPYVSIQTNPGVTPGNKVPLNPMATNAFNPNAQDATPIGFAYVPEGQVAFWPTPDLAYPVSLTLVCQPRDGVSEVPDELITKWRVAFEDGALAYLYNITGEAWANPQLAMKHELAFRSAINNAKANVAMNFQSGSQRAMPRRFIVR